MVSGKLVMAHTVTKLRYSQVDEPLASHLSSLSKVRFLNRKTITSPMSSCKNIKAHEKHEFVQRTRWHSNSSLSANVILKTWQAASRLAKVSSLLQKHSHIPRTVNVDWFIQLRQSRRQTTPSYNLHNTAVTSASCWENYATQHPLPIHALAWQTGWLQNPLNNSCPRMSFVLRFIFSSLRPK